jgi:hypothetical protein
LLAMIFGHGFQCFVSDGSSEHIGCHLQYTCKLATVCCSGFTRHNHPPPLPCQITWFSGIDCFRQIIFNWCTSSVIWTH